MTTDAVDRSTEATARNRPSAAKNWLKAIELTSRIGTNPQRLFADLVEERAKHQGDRPALISDASTFTYRTLAGRINQYARWALSAGIKPGDRVCLMMAGEGGLCRCLARHQPGRRGRRADQHKTGRNVARPLHQRC
jgi:fatty-acyl-CoA synthase